MRTWTRALLLITASGLLAACAPDRLIVDADWTPRRITANIAQVKPGVYGAKNMTVVFRNRTEMRSDIVELEFIGQLAARNRPPYNIYAGRRCHGCGGRFPGLLFSLTLGFFSVEALLAG